MDLRYTPANPIARRIPRARGDGPAGGLSGAIPAKDSPRSRGWTVVDLDAHSPARGFPALAGMDPGRRRRSRRRRGIPRARGDGPASRPTTYRSWPDSPRSRGWTGGSLALVRADDGFPALAGMDRHGGSASPGPRRIPRARGDEPASGSSPRPSPRDSPRSRGWTRRAATLTPSAGGFPALAGMDPRPRDSPPLESGIPRARGDGPAAYVRRVFAAEDSPRSRGWTPGPRPRTPGPEGFPALAGMDPSIGSRRQTTPRIPRARGDGPRSPVSPSVPGRDSPRSRGWTLRRGALMPRPSGFPALAGMDPATWQP